MKPRGLLISAFVALATSACTGSGLTATPVITQADVTGEAIVEVMDILVLESFPVQINVVASGYLPDGCTTIDEILRERDGDTFLVTITTTRPVGVECTEALVPFEEVISLDVYGLAAGVYTVTVNGLSDTFELSVDNIPQLEESSSGTIVGLVWHDLCAPPWQGTPPATPPEGCVESAAGGYEANGVLESGEPGIEGVVVALGAGVCPSTGLGTATTGAHGSYPFTGLSAGLTVSRSIL